MAVRAPTSANIKPIKQGAISSERIRGPVLTKQQKVKRVNLYAAPALCSKTYPEDTSGSAECHANPPGLLTPTHKRESLLGSGFIALAPRVFAQRQTRVADWPSVYVRID